MIPREVIDTIRDRVDISEVVGQVVTLRRKGSTLSGLCPFHNEKTPSFNVVPAKGIYHCFGCGAGGDAFKFLMETQGLSFNEAVKELGARVGVTVEERALSPVEIARTRARTDLYEVCDLACRHFEAVLRTRPEGEPARRYLKERGMNEETWTRYRLGYAPPSWSALLDGLARQGVDAAMAVKAGLAREREGSSGAYDLFRGRVIIPISDPRGRIVAFGGRHLEDMPGRSGDDKAAKYVNSPETEIYHKSKTLYALSQARAGIQNEGFALVVEGYFDVLALHQAGFTQAIATCGTALTPDHLRILRPLTTKVVALFDSDEAGVRAALRSLEPFIAEGMEPSRLDLGEAKDPDEFIQRFGAEAFTGRLKQSEPLLDRALRLYRQRLGGSPEGRRQALAEIAPVLRRMDGASRSVAVETVSRILGVPDQVVSEFLGLSRSSVAPPRPQARRLLGDSADVHHLVWLLVHHPSQVAPLVQSVDPSLVTSRMDLARVIARLLQGESLTSLLDDVEDPGLAEGLRAVATQGRVVRDGREEGVYTEENAAMATRQLLARLELRQVEEELHRIQSALESCGPDADGSSYRESLVKKSLLTRKRLELSRIVSRKPPQ